MANTRFKTHHGLNSTANSYISGDLEVTGNVQIGGTLSYSGVSIGNFIPDSDQRDLGNTSNRWDLFGFTANLASTLRATGATSLGNTLTVNGAATFSNTITVENSANLTSTLTVNGAASFSNTLTVVGSVISNNLLTANGNTSFSNTLFVLTTNSTSNVLTVGAANASFDSGTLFVDAVNNRVGVNNTTPGVALHVTGAADISSTANIQSSANIGGTLGVVGNTTLSGTLQTIGGNVNFDSGVLFVDATANRVGVNNTTPDASFTVTGTANISGNTVLSGTLQTISGNVNIDSGVLFVDATNNRVGVNNTTPDAALSVTGAANVSGLITGASGARVTGTVNVSSTLNLGSNLSINTSSVLVNNYLTVSGLLSSNTTSGQVDGFGTLFVSEVSPGDQILFSGNTTLFTVQSVTNNTILTLTTNGPAASSNTAQRLATTIVSLSEVSTNGTLSAQRSANLHGNVALTNQLLSLTTNSTSSLVSFGAGNVNFDSGTLFVDAVNNRIGIGNTAPSVTMQVTGTVNTSTITTTTITSGNSTQNVVANSIGVTTPTIDTVTLIAGNSTSNVFANSTGLYAPFVNATSLTVSSFNTGTVSVGNSTVNASINSTSIVVGNTTFNTFISSAYLDIDGYVNIAGDFAVDTNVFKVDVTTDRVGINKSGAPGAALDVVGEIYVSAGVNTATFSVGTNFVANTIGVYHTGTVNALSFTTTYFVANTSQIGFTNFIANSAGLYHTGTVNAASFTTSAFTANTTAASVGSNVVLTVSRITVGNSTVNSFINSTAVSTGSILGSSISLTGAVSGLSLTLGTATFSQNEISASAANATFSSLGVGTVATGVAGEIVATGDVTAYYSDRRLKNIIGNIDNPLEKLQQINGIYYTQNELAEEMGYKHYDRQVGLVAQEVEVILPEAVKIAAFDRHPEKESKSGENYLTIQYEKLVPLLVEAIKELKQQLDELKNGNQG